MEGHLVWKGGRNLQFELQGLVRRLLSQQPCLLASLPGGQVDQLNQNLGTKKAITASFEQMDTEGDKNTITFVYTLQNNTDSDYQVSDEGMVHLGAMLKRSKEFSFVREGFLKADYPIYLPAKSRIRFTLHVQYPYAIKEDLTASDDAKHDWETTLCQFADKEFSNLDGFVLLDDNSRYQVDMPNGWTARAKEPLRIKPTAPIQ